MLPSSCLCPVGSIPEHPSTLYDYQVAIDLQFVSEVIIREKKKFNGDQEGCKLDMNRFLMC
jgi:hypothetical protein